LLRPSRAIEHIYKKIEWTARNLLPNLTLGYTARELQIILSNKLEGSQKNGLRKRLFGKAPHRIETIVLLYMLYSYSEHKPSSEEVRQGIRQWLRLRWALWFARILNGINQL
jgi:hypothetical protein